MIFETDRLIVSALDEADAPFVLALVNEPRWLKFIGDRGVRTLEDAGAYIRNGPVASYHARNFGLWAVRLRREGTAIGMCGLIKRDTLEDVDVGFAFFEKYSGSGYATEAVRATLRHGWEKVRLPRIVAIVDRENTASIRVLEKSGLRFERDLLLPPDHKPGRLFAISAPPPLNPAVSGEITLRRSSSFF